MATRRSPRSIRASHQESKNPNFRAIHTREFCRRVLEESGEDPEGGGNVNGHVPVRVEKGERPRVAGRGALGGGRHHPQRAADPALRRAPPGCRHRTSRAIRGEIDMLERLVEALQDPLARVPRPSASSRVRCSVFGSGPNTEHRTPNRGTK